MKEKQEKIWLEKEKLNWLEEQNKLAEEYFKKMGKKGIKTDED